MQQPNDSKLTGHLSYIIRGTISGVDWAWTMMTSLDHVSGYQAI